MPRYLVVRQGGTDEVVAASAAEARAQAVARGLTVRAVLPLEMPTIGGSLERLLWTDRGTMQGAARLLAELGRQLRITDDRSGALEGLAHTFPVLAGEIAAMRAEIGPGQSLHPPFERRAHVFGPVAVEVVRAGEAHGRLAEACEEAAAVLEKRRPLAVRALLLTSNLWTDMLSVVALGVLLIATSIPLAVGCLLAPLAGSTPIRAWHALRFRLPVLGHLFTAVVFSRFLQVFAALTRVGAPLSRTLELAVAATGDSNVTRDVLPRLLMVTAGEPVSSVLRASGRFPREIADMIATGESSGRLDSVSEWLADYLHDRSEAAVDRLAGHVAWLVPTVAGVLVFLLLLKFYLGRAGGAGLSLPSPGEMWHNLLHGPKDSAAP